MMTPNGKFWLSIGLAVFLLSACQTPPTKTRDVPSRQLRSAELMLAPVQITAETVVIDARPRFDYSVAHIPGSIPLQWTDFTEPEPKSRGVLQQDLFAITRRLARSGIGPLTPVVVVGQGLNGNGEEGRIAWMLAYLGVEKVQFAQIDSLKARMTNSVDEAYPKPVAMWKPDKVESLNVTQKEVRFSLNKQAMHKPVAYRDLAPTEYRLIDVRSEKSYMNKEGLGAVSPVPNMEAINIPWQEFFTPEFRPQRDIANKLKSVGILPEHRIIVMDESGVSSAAVTMALRALGYEKAGNFSGGLNEMMK